LSAFFYFSSSHLSPRPNNYTSEYSWDCSSTKIEAIISATMPPTKETAHGPDKTTNSVKKVAGKQETVLQRKNAPSLL
jgi:hypothetical protein